MIGTRQVMFYEGQKRRVHYATFDIERTRRFLIGVNGLTLFCLFLSVVVRGDKR